MKKERQITTKELGEILIKNVRSFEIAVTTIKKTSADVIEQNKTISNKTLKVEKHILDLSELNEKLNKINNAEKFILKGNQELFSKLEIFQNKNKTRLPNTLIYVLISFVLVNLIFSFFAYKTIGDRTVIKELKEKNQIMQKVLKEVPKNQLDKYINNARK